MASGGGAGIYKLFGEGGNDILLGGSNSDELNGGSGVLKGGDGEDYLWGGRGRDKLFGGDDADFFRFQHIKDSKPGSNRDIIYDFDLLRDFIDLKDIDAKKGVSGNQEFKWIGKSKFHDKKGELRYEDKGKKVIVQGDTNGDGKSDSEILIKVGKLRDFDFDL